MNVFFLQEWTDDNLRWNASEYENVKVEFNIAE